MCESLIMSIRDKIRQKKEEIESKKSELYILQIQYDALVKSSKEYKEYSAAAEW